MECRKVVFSDVGWSDISATTALASTVLQALGYQTETKILSVPVTYTAMSTETWTCSWATGCRRWSRYRPLSRGGHGRDRAHEPDRGEIHAGDEPGRRRSGIDDFGKIAQHKDALAGKIYGIEPGNDGNRLLLDMVADNKFDLGTFEVVESSEQGMLAQVARADAAGKPVIFLGWEPHPMNSQFQMTYLSGGDEVFGPDFGGARVDTNTRAGYVEACPNVGKFLQNLEFTLPWRTRSWA